MAALRLLHASSLPSFDHNQQPLYAGKLRDISKGGGGLILDGVVSAGTIVMLKLPSTQGNLALTKLIRIRRSQYESESLWRHGAIFAKKLNDAELATLVEFALRRH